MACDGAVFVTGRLPEDSLAADLAARSDDWDGAGLRSVRAIGDAHCPGTIVAAVWEGRRYAEELEASTEDSDETPFKREATALAPGEQ